ncbi:MAG: glycosyltransferase family 2 protein [Algibacter sp.]|uniref:glycosyltransferase family 2 protein n=1 Tax=Algibacter sp. TaxID=1872428 RepID=UPI0026196A69|nr:glycosyltransferase family 2 protein [Algibacter sp.]MDG1729362.1 glycosyltransferase family 2 protein [Algibacter sp.]MDG2177333.1 glycosyltransferase family 2 protein [Algibacter sp.]
MSVLVSIIIPAYNRGYLILDTLKSVQDQSYQNIECIVVDDHSDDDTQNVVKTFCSADSRFSYLKRPSNRLKGANACRNFGLENSKGLYINWLDSDDLLTSNHIESHIAIHEKHQNIEASVSEAGIFKDFIGDSEQKWSNIFSKSDLTEDMLTSKVSWQTAAVLWKKSQLHPKPFREDLSSSQEWTFHLLQVIDGLNYFTFNKVTVYVRRHQDCIGNDVSKNKFQSTFFSRYIILKTLYNKRRLSKIYQKALLNKMLQAVKKTIFFNYDSVLYKQIIKLISIIFIVHFKLGLLKVIFLYIPLYRITKRGETLFKL